MIENFRNFEVVDLFGASLSVEFRWIQNGISIRHADTIDVKFDIFGQDVKQEKVIALPHPLLLAASTQTGHAITDPWCSRIGAMHLAHMLQSGDDIEKHLVTLTLEQILFHAGNLKPAPALDTH